MRHIISLSVVVAIAVAALIAPIITPAISQAQQGNTAQLVKPANVDFENTGDCAVTISWDTTDSTPFYRIGWVAYDDVTAAQSEGRDWRDDFAFSDVANRGQGSRRIANLEQGKLYAFIVASLDQRFGSNAVWSEWIFVTPGKTALPPTPPPSTTPNKASRPHTLTPAATPIPSATVTPMP